jgi:L-alanine-DL-glutamate epimerase-like enolase superfamily enzyme
VRVVSIETVRPSAQPNVCFVEVTTDDGLIGLGEAFYGPSAVEAYLHDAVAPALFDVDDPAPETIARMLVPYVGYQGGGAEVRANGAIDLALWDLAGKRSGQSLIELLGGAVRTSLPIYNTCAGPRYVAHSNRQTSDNWGLDDEASQYEDLVGFLERPAELAKDLLANGIRAMKIWPFDTAAEATLGFDLRERDLARGLEIVDAIRQAVGLEMDILIELHGLWNHRNAAKICRALEPYEPFWVEDPVRPDDVSGLVSLRAETTVTIATGETVVGRRGFRPLLENGVVDVVTLDIGWTGGLTEARRIASLADSYGVPIAPHDCTGPVSLSAAVHLGCSQPNGLVQETARAFLHTWYRDVAVGHPDVVDGRIEPTAAPGHGVSLRSDLEDRMDVIRRVTHA